MGRLNPNAGPKEESRAATDQDISPPCRRRPALGHTDTRALALRLGVTKTDMLALRKGSPPASRSRDTRQRACATPPPREDLRDALRGTYNSLPRRQRALK